MPIASQASTRRTRDSTCAQPIRSPHITQEAERCAAQHRACPRDVEMTKCSGGAPPPVLFGRACSASEHRAHTNTNGRPLHRRCQRSCQWSRSPPPNFVRRPRRAFLSDFCAKREKLSRETRTRSDTEAKNGPCRSIHVLPLGPKVNLIEPVTMSTTTAWEVDARPAELRSSSKLLEETSIGSWVYPLLPKCDVRS